MNSEINWFSAFLSFLASILSVSLWPNGGVPTREARLRVANGGAVTDPLSVSPTPLVPARPSPWLLAIPENLEHAHSAP